MAKYNATILTENGLSLARQAAQGRTTFSITRAATTSVDISDYSQSQIEGMKSLPNIVQWASVSRKYQGQTQIGVELVFTNFGLKNEYKIQGIGLYAKQPGPANEVLYAVTTASDPYTMPDYSSGALYEFTLTAYVQVGQGKAVTIDISPAGPSNDVHDLANYGRLRATLTNSIGESIVDTSGNQIVGQVASPITDTELKTAGMPADAKCVGDTISADRAEAASEMTHIRRKLIDEHNYAEATYQRIADADKLSNRLARVEVNQTLNEKKITEEVAQTSLLASQGLLMVSVTSPSGANVTSPSGQAVAGYMDVAGKTVANAYSAGRDYVDKTYASLEAELIALRKIVAEMAK